MKPIAIAMITDFFHPNIGGVENKRGHKVIVITHSHSPNRVGIHWLLPSLKVYYLPFVPIASSAMLPNLFPTSGRFSFGSTFTSSLRVPVYPLSGTKEFCILIYLASKRCSLTTVCLASKTLRSFVYLILGGRAPSFEESSLTNQAESEHFQPGTLKTSDIVTIVVLSYLHTAKASISSSSPLPVSATPSRTSALSLAVTVIDLPQMREKHNLQDRIELLGPFRPNAVRFVLVRGAIFLDTSLTDPLASPSSRWLAQGCIFAEPEEDDVFRAISEAIEIISDGKHDPIHAHERVKTFYNWAQVAERTKVVYDTVVKSRQMEFWERMKRFVRSSRSMVGIC
ncbi:hypothetical protein ARMGADRAFT_1078500 [Armillaria gallica]|uniref:PIGA GPI anchor biosynthesis domain-containing protein n=1 Tax=Armillaria gallica TaxID=47427 RepID=A0A2H3DZT7_ARMGA|nr:hypothetical protein ARMGADRAFT_1078500 [Armillaria gallica]